MNLKEQKLRKIIREELKLQLNEGKNLTDKMMNFQTEVEDLFENFTEEIVNQDLIKMNDKKYEGLVLNAQKHLNQFFNILQKIK